MDPVEYLWPTKFTSLLHLIDWEAFYTSHSITNSHRGQVNLIIGKPLSIVSTKVPYQNFLLVSNVQHSDFLNVVILTWVLILWPSNENHASGLPTPRNKINNLVEGSSMYCKETVAKKFHNDRCMHLYINKFGCPFWKNTSS